jgi:hypothetical protein
LNLAGLDGLESTGNSSNKSLFISGNDNLINLVGLENLRSIGGSLAIRLNPHLINLHGLETLESAGNVRIDKNFMLQTLDGLNSLNTIGSEIYLQLNTALTSLTGLESLNSVKSLRLQSNYGLEDISSLENIDSESLSNLAIIGNESLAFCAIQSICDFIANPNATIEISYNAPGCNSEEEVEAACLVGVEESAVGSRQSAVRVFPNPTYEIVHIEFEIENPSLVRIQVFNAMGGMVADLSDSILPNGKHQITWNAAELPAGLYFIRLNAGKEVAGLKLIKQ